MNLFPTFLPFGLAESFSSTTNFAAGDGYIVASFDFPSNFGSRYTVLIPSLSRPARNFPSCDLETFGSMTSSLLFSKSLLCFFC